MDAAEAQATLKDYLGDDVRPALGDATLARLVARFRIADTAGRRPDDTHWEPSYALNAAAAEGWRMKASRVAADFNFSADGASFSKGDVIEHFLQMERQYAAMDNGALYLERVSPDYRADRLWL